MDALVKVNVRGNFQSPCIQEGFSEGKIGVVVSQNGYDYCVNLFAFPLFCTGELAGVTVLGDARLVCLNFLVHSGIGLASRGDRGGYFVDCHLDYLWELTTTTGLIFQNTSTTKKHTANPSILQELQAPLYTFYYF